jgi:hypothetical protein
LRHIKADVPVETVREDLVPTRKLAAITDQIRENQAGKTLRVMLSGLCRGDYLVDDDLGHGIIHLALELQCVAHFVKCRPHRLDVRGFYEVL